MHYGMQTPDGGVMWGKWVYREIAPPERLVFIVSFSDEAGGIIRHPFSVGWPLEMLSTVTCEEDGGGTDLTVSWAAHNATELERKTFDAAQRTDAGRLDRHLRAAHRFTFRIAGTFERH